MLLIAVYVFLAFFCVALMQKKVLLDPSLIVIPCVLIVPQSLASIANLYVNLLPACAVLAMVTIITYRQTLQIESVTRFAAGSGLGAFVALQVLALGINAHYLLVLLLITSLGAVAVLFGRLNLTACYASPLSLMAGLGMGVVHFISLTSGRAFLPVNSPGASAVVWLVSIIGALVGVLALPNTSMFVFDPEVIIASLMAVLLGTLVSRHINSNQFESKVLFAIVLVMMLSVWGHVCFQYFW